MIKFSLKDSMSVFSKDISFLIDSIDDADGGELQIVLEDGDWRVFFVKNCLLIKEDSAKLEIALKNISSMVEKRDAKKGSSYS